MNDFKCLVCGMCPCSFEWTDFHGEATCFTCGTAYQLIQYDEDDKRIEDVPPKHNVKASWVPLIKKYWEETNQSMGDGRFLGPPKYPERRRALNEWLDAHEDEWPREKESEL